MCDILTVTSLLNSACMTPDFHLIDPRLLKLGVSGEDGITLANKVPNTPDDQPSLSNNDEDTGLYNKTMA